MQKSIFLFLTLLHFGCSNQREANVPKNDTPLPRELTIPAPASGPRTAAWTPPATRPGDDGWEMYLDAQTLTPQTAAAFRPGFETPEAALLSFYASRMRGDDDWKQALAAEGNPAFADGDLKRLGRKLEKAKDWKYLEVRLIGKKPNDEELYVKVFMKIAIGSEVEDGTDEATLVQVGGRWYVLAIPT